MTRKSVSPSAVSHVLTLSRRRCSICFGLDRDFSRKRGQIAHLDRNSANSEPTNLVFLCFEHHDEYDSQTRQSKGLQAQEVREYRQALYDAVARYFSGSSDHSEGPEEPALLARGEFKFYLGDYEESLDSACAVLASISEAIARHNQETGEHGESMRRLLAKPRLDLKVAAALNEKAGIQMEAFGEGLVMASRPLSSITKRMLVALARASAVASDAEASTKSQFERKLLELRRNRAQLERVMRSAAAARDEFAAYPRASSRFNRGKRLAIASIDEHIRLLSVCAEEFSAAECAHERILSLF